MTPGQLSLLVREHNRYHGQGNKPRRGSVDDLIAMRPPVKVAS